MNSKPWSALSKQTALASDDFFPFEKGGAEYTILWSSIKAEIKAYLDTIYQPVNPDLTAIAIAAGNAHNKGSIIYFDGAAWNELSALTQLAGYLMTIDNTGKPVWKSPTPFINYISSGPNGMTISSEMCVNRKIVIDNAGQLNASVVMVLPDAADVKTEFRVIISGVTGRTFQVQSTTPGQIYVNGSASADDYVQFSSPSAGDTFTGFSAKRGSQAAWYISSGYGTLLHATFGGGG